MRQSRTKLLVEAVVNAAAGYGVAVATQIMVFPFFGLHVTLAGNLAIGLIFMIVSIARGYVLRRLFETLRPSKKRSGAPASARDG